jgi:hypothetical protein
MAAHRAGAYMKIIVTFLCGLAAGAGGLIVLQHPHDLITLSGLFPDDRQPPQIVSPTITGCEPAWVCIKHPQRE